MAFCTNCGSKMNDDSRFCPSCGAQSPEVPASRSSQSSPASEHATAATPAQTAGTWASSSPTGGTVQSVKGGDGGGLVKVILIVLVVLVGLGLLSAAGIFWAAYKVKKSVRIEQSGDSATVQTPWGSVSSNQDPMKVAQDLGIDVYPGAKPLEGASAVTVGNLAVGAVEFETADPMDKVEQFYRARFPNSTIDVADENSHTLAMMTNKGMINVILERTGSGTKINISRTGHGKEPRESE